MANDNKDVTATWTAGPQRSPARVQIVFIISFGIDIFHYSSGCCIFTLNWLEHDLDEGWFNVFRIHFVPIRMNMNSDKNTVRISFTFNSKINAFHVQTCSIFFMFIIIVFLETLYTSCITLGGVTDFYLIYIWPLY